ncbi:hypothetical protein OKW21_002569 [Catalinimonas alkaloidigena]|uniref:hypothetical protein n=1 Tax=Catalinimonas alkaloidigena TaxID=1075417 RepID=UPI002404FCDC|nr:hypothetical protein [Catalinimonas alkaloidigena]MDF9797306.1 hypothetical protein [Catalinimonas alkaloidigena]
MKFLFKIILIIAFSYLLELYLPWWSVIIAAFLVNMWLPSKGFIDFLSGFLGVGLLWLTYAWLIDADTSSILSERIADLFSLPNGSFMIASSGLVGGVAGGFAALSGSQFRRIFMKDAPKPGYYS